MSRGYCPLHTTRLGGNELPGRWTGWKSIWCAQSPPQSDLHFNDRAASVLSPSLSIRGIQFRDVIHSPTDSSESAKTYSLTSQERSSRLEGHARHGWMRNTRSRKERIQSEMNFGVASAAVWWTRSSFPPYWTLMNSPPLLDSSLVIASLWRRAVIQKHKANLPQQSRKVFVWGCFRSPFRYLKVGKSHKVVSLIRAAAPALIADLQSIKDLNWRCWWKF